MGSICPYQDFYGGRPVKRKAKEDKEPASEDEVESSTGGSGSQGAPDYGIKSL